MHDQFIIGEQEKDVETKAWGLGGIEIDPEVPDALAKAVTDPNSGNTKYFCKRGTNGPEAGLLYNPQSPMFNPQAARRFHDAMGRGQYEFKRVSKECFDLYLKFLKTGNPLNLRGAERA